MFKSILNAEFHLENINIFFFCHSGSFIHSGSKEPISDEDMFQQLFSGASEQMLNHLREQIKSYKLKKDPRANRWDRDTISLALPLWNRSPQVTSCVLISGCL